jgi:N-acetylglutamate synthase-like GNAT family acetyltransferase
VGIVSENLEIRRASQGDLAAITSLVRQAIQSRTPTDEAEMPSVNHWLFSKGLWVALQGPPHGRELVGVAAWQAENLVSVTDVFYIFPESLWATTGGQLLETIEAEAKTLMCEINAVLLPDWAPEVTHAFFQQAGYERQDHKELHRIWQEVLSEFITGSSVLMVKQLQDRMRMVPL